MFERTFQLFDQFIAQRNASGGVALINWKGQVFGPHTVSNLSFFPDSAQVTEDTIFDIASLTKVVATTTGLLLLLQDGMIRLDDSITRFLTGVPIDKQGITIRQLMTHTSGLPAWAPVYQNISQPKDATAYILNLPLDPPGTKVEYSCMGYIVLGRIIEICTNQSLDQFITDHVFRPLKMNDTFYQPDSDLYDRIAYTEWCAVDRQFLRGVVHDENARSLQGISGNAGVFTTAVDLAKFCNMMLGKAPAGAQLLKPATLNLLSQSFTKGMNDNRTLGWLLKSPTHSSGGDLMGPRAFGHTGFTGTSIWIDPDLDAYFILLTNRVHPTRENTEIIRFRPLFHNSAITEISEALTVL